MLPTEMQKYQHVSVVSLQVSIATVPLIVLYHDQVVALVIRNSRSCLTSLRERLSLTVRTSGTSSSTATGRLVGMRGPTHCFPRSQFRERHQRFRKAGWRFGCICRYCHLRVAKQTDVVPELRFAHHESEYNLSLVSCVTSPSV